ncbi:MAG: hypothetical protein JWO19_1255 [Bryobacterales bacterium]|nr:hypothetical protein [Bryobacterales bacterium]
MKRVRQIPIGSLAELQVSLAKAREQYRDALVLQRKTAELLADVRGRNAKHLEAALVHANSAVSIAARRYELTLRDFIAEGTHTNRKRAS